MTTVCEKDHCRGRINRFLVLFCIQHQSIHIFHLRHAPSVFVGQERSSSTMSEPSNDAELKEKKRKKALRKMGKILGQAWNLPNAEPFHTANKSDSIFCLTSLGQKVDEKGYRGGRHGWEDFARDIGGVYNRHIHR